MDPAQTARRSTAPAVWLAGRLAPELGERARLIEICRAELTWARADGLRLAADDEGWQDLLLPHERTAARLLELWGHLHPLEHRLREGLRRLRAQRHAGWPAAVATLGDVRRYRHGRRALLRAFLAAAADYRRERAKVRSAGGCLGLRPAA